ncbi:MAG TPA: ATPase, T2SS/T4P/T4SS family [Polyangiaceae bacterium]|nr:ATPase, T2SS/T4P/T4SS family [Polyangiaceae bacterium]
MSLEVLIARDQHRERRALGVLDSVSIGRDTDCTISLDSSLVSRRHVTLAITGSVMRVQDSSRNGTLAGSWFLNNSAREVPLDTPLTVGEYTLRVSTTEPAALESPATPAAPAPLGPEARDETASERARELAAEEQLRDAVSLRREIHRLLLEHLDLATVQASKLDDPSLRPKVLTALRRIVQALDHRIAPDLNRDVLVGEMADEALGLGPLENLLSDPTVNEIMVVDPSTIYIEQRGKLRRTDASFTDDDRVRAIIERIVTPLGRRIDESSPIVDARLRDGSRVNAVVRPLALKGSTITIRKFSKSPLTLEKLIAFGAMSPEMGQFLVRCVRAKKNLVISGGTGSGKTTLLNVLSSAIPSDERVVTIEDAAELQLGQPHVVSLETRPPNMEGKGEYSIRDLVKNALRMRPDRIVVGECRGGEALDMLQAMNTGHDGSLTTTHANSPREAVARLETLVLMAGLELPVRAIREQIAGAVHVLVQQSRLSDGSRKVTAVSEISGLNDHGEIELLPIFRYVRSGTGAEGQVLGDFQATGFLPTFLHDFQLMGLIGAGERFL